MSNTPSHLSLDQKRQWLCLIRTPQIGPSTFRQLLNRYGSAADALDALPDLLLRGGKRPNIPTDAAIDAEIEKLTSGGGTLIALGEPNYPTLLQHIHDAPPILSVWGTLPTKRQHISIVGSRNASAAGNRMTSLLAKELGAADFVVVSGLARGIDAAAHAASLQTGTIAVLAGGLDHIYPNENKPLARQIIDAGGAVITEMPMGSEPRAKDFPRRNRIVSGLSAGTIVIEAAKRSGSLITARMALEQNREVFAVPGFPLDPRSAGTNQLIQQGAYLVSSTEDVLDQLNDAEQFAPTLMEPNNGPFENATSYADTEPSQTDRDKLLNALSHTPTSIDDLVSVSALEIGVVHNLLLEFELLDKIERASGNLISLT